MNFSVITQAYPTAILTGVEQYFFRNKWHGVAAPPGPETAIVPQVPGALSAGHAADRFTPFIEALLAKGATKIALSVRVPETKTQYTVFASAAALRGKEAAPRKQPSEPIYK